MRFEQLHSRWKQNASIDPMWSILADPSKRDGQWDVGEFFETGKKALEAALKRVDLDLSTFSGKAALDFGCGMGRISQALASYFPVVHGVDISEQMIKLADKYNPSPEKITYHYNPQPNLRLFSKSSIDFIYCMIVLQHMPPALAWKYLREFVRVLSREGLALFQVPHKRKRQNRIDGIKSSLRPWIPNKLIDSVRALRGHHGPVLEMYGIDPASIEELFDELHCEVLVCSEDGLAGPEWESYTYLVRKL